MYSHARAEDWPKSICEHRPADSGFADEATQAAKLMAVFRHFNTDKDGWVSYDEFQAALVRLNFVGVQREVSVRPVSRHPDPCVDCFVHVRPAVCLIAMIVTAVASCHTKRWVACPLAPV
jgi:hypothetical protein